MNREKENNPMFGKLHSEDAKMRIAASRRNSKWLYDPLTGMQKAIDKNLVEEYIRKGWKLGRLKYKKEPSYLLSF